jgi:putative membrane protein
MVMELRENQTMMSSRDHKRITDAIRTAENNTSGDIFAVVAQQSDDYFYIAGFMAALWALVLGVVLALGAPFVSVHPGIFMLAAAQLASFSASLLLFYYFPSAKLLFVPRSVSYKRASNNAVRQFFAHGIHKTSDRCGILIFISLDEQYAEIVADMGINQRVAQADWDTMVGVLVDHARQGQVPDGLIEVIGSAGNLLGQHFPHKKGQKNELADRLIEI